MKNTLLYSLSLMLLIACRIDAASAPDNAANAINNISFVNDSDKTVYICRDRDDLGEVAPKASKCFGIDFFMDAQGVPAPRYFKISFSKKSCGDEPDIKYALAPNRNYRITTTAALKTDEQWLNGCPPLTPTQQAAEQASGGVVAKVITKGAELADDIKNGTVKGFNATSNFFSNTAPNAVKAAYTKTANFITHDVGNAFQSGYETVKGGLETAGGAIASGAETAGKAIESGAETVGHGIESGAKSVGHALNPANW